MFHAGVSLKPYNTFGIEVQASFFGKFSNTEELSSLFDEMNKKPLPYFILGGGSNVLLTQNFEGYVLKNEIRGLSEHILDDNTCILTAGAGEVWHEFVLFSLEKGWRGLENLSLIPGSVGASPMQNIGAYGVEIKDVFEQLTAYHIPTGEIHVFDKEACSFGYRESVFKHEFKNQYVITEVSFRLHKDTALSTHYGAINDELKAMGVETPNAQDVSRAVIRIRESKLPNPKEIGNAGSFFKNPIVETSLADKLKISYPDLPVYPIQNDQQLCKVAAGWLIENVGLKGYDLTTHGVHKKQALVLVNYGGATGKNIYDLSTYVIDQVKSKFGIVLEREVNIL